MLRNTGKDVSEFAVERNHCFATMSAFTCRNNDRIYANMGPSKADQIA